MACWTRCGAPDERRRSRRLERATSRAALTLFLCSRESLWTDCINVHVVGGSRDEEVLLDRRRAGEFADRKKVYARIADAAIQKLHAVLTVP